MDDPKGRDGQPPELDLDPETVHDLDADDETVEDVRGGLHVVCTEARSGC